MPDDPASLERLHDVVSPDPVPWWPLAPGWYVVGAVLVILAGIAAWRWWRHWRSQAYRRAALAELNDWEAGRDGDGALAAKDVAQLATLLRRTALAVLPRDQVAGLPDAAWKTVLNQAHPESGPDSWAWLPDAYRPDGSLSGEQARKALAEVRHWLRHHRFEPTPPASC